MAASALVAMILTTGSSLWLAMCIGFPRDVASRRLIGLTARAAVALIICFGTLRFR